MKRIGRLHQPARCCECQAILDAPGARIPVMAGTVQGLLDA
jgi:hypothetical protein